MEHFVNVEIVGEARGWLRDPSDEFHDLYYGDYEPFFVEYKAPVELSVNVRHVKKLQRVRYPLVKLGSEDLNRRWYHRLFHLNPGKRWFLHKVGDVDVVAVCIVDKDVIYVKETPELKALIDANVK